MSDQPPPNDPRDPAGQPDPAGQYPPQQPQNPYGAPAYPQQPYGQQPYGQPYGQPVGTNGKAIASLILGICGLVLCGLFGIAAIVVGGNARREMAGTGQAGHGFALAGVVMGWISVALMLVGLLVIVIVVASGSS